MTTEAHPDQMQEQQATKCIHPAAVGRLARAVVSCVTALCVAFAPACGQEEASGDPDDDAALVPRVGLDPAMVAAEVAELRAQAVVLAHSAAVGALPAESGVDAAGEAHYSIPIEVTPGVRGMEPELSITYGSNSGDGMLGDRFSLTGLSGVSRCPQSINDDDAYRPVLFDDEDALCLDGERMVLVDGVPGQAGAEYRTKVNPFSRIVLDHDISFLGGTITVSARDGRLLTYGTSPASLWKGVTGGEQVPWRWNLLRQCDRWDNCVEYEYEHGDWAATGPTEIRLLAIRYGGTGAPASRRAVELAWTDRDDASSSWFYGVELRHTEVIEEITISGPFGEVVRSYELDYQADPFSGVTQLAEARLCDAIGACLPDTTFTWSGNSGAGFDLETWDNINAFDSTIVEEQAALLQSKHTLVGDFDGDGDAELLFRSSDPASPWLMWFGDAEGSGAGSQTQLPSLDAVLPFDNGAVQSLLDATRNQPDFDQILADNLHRFQPELTSAVVDFDGDTLDDLMIPVRDSEGGIDQDLHNYADGFVIGINQGGGSFALFLPDDGSVKHIYQMTPADHDGDSFTDVWMCRGEHYNDAEWVLAHHQGGGLPELGFEFLPTGVACSAHDEITLASLDGGPANLLVIPAYDGPGGELVPADERIAYWRLHYDILSGVSALEPSGLPRDNYQRTHDASCRNGLAITNYGGPIFGAGMGFDKHLDLNGDGLEDLLRFELASGDGAAQAPVIGDGLEYTTWDQGVLCGSDDELNYDAVIVPFYNTGTGFLRGAPAMEPPGNAHANFWLNFVGAQVLDVNDDGRPDLLMPGSGPGSEWTVLGTLSDGQFTTASVSLPSGWPAYDDDDTWREQLDAFMGVRILAIDAEPGWRPDLAFVGLVPGNASAWPTAVNIYKMQGGDSLGRMETAVDGLGASTTFGYAAKYVPDPQAAWPKAPLRAGLWVTTEHSRTAASGSTRTTSYEYKGAAIDRRGEGFLGFAVVTSTEGAVGDDSLDRVRTEYVQAYDPNLRAYPLRGQPAERVRYTQVDDGEGEHVERELWEWTTRALPIAGGPTFFSYATSHQEQGYRFGAGVCSPEFCDQYFSNDSYREKTTTETRDDFAYLTASTESVMSGAHVLASTTMTQDEIVHDTDAWLLGQVGHMSIESCRGGTCATRELGQGFDPATGAIAWSTIQPGHPTLQLQSEYVYDAHGNVQQVDQTDPGGWTRTTTTEWDPEGALPLSTTNAVGHTAYVVHHGASGALLATVDAAGLTEKTGYDGLFRPVATSLHSSPMGGDDGAPTTIVYADAEGSDVELAVMSVQSTTTHGQRVTEYLGSLGQVLERRWYGMAAVPTGAPEVIGVGGDVFQRFGYDQRGQNTSISVPQWVGQEPPGGHERELDSLGRITQLTAPDGTILERTVYIHGGLEDNTLARTFTTKNGATLQRDVFVAADGLVTSERDELGTVTCLTHGPFSLLASTVRNCEGMSLKPQSTTLFDALGHPTLQQDPALGARLSTWNAFGELTSHTDGAGRVSNYGYDAIGRMIARNDPDGAAAFTWDTERLGALSGTSSPDGVIEDHDYDAFGRPFRQTTTVLSSSGLDNYVMESGFGPGGRLETLKYPTPDSEPAFTARIRYDDAGYLRTVVDNATNALRWIVRTADPSAQPMWESYGNGVQTQRAYDPQRLWVDAITTTGAPAVQDLRYTWSPEGELQRRDDVLVGQYEELDYDNLWRLTSARVTKGATSSARSMTYDVLGNVRSMTGVGTYAYDNAGRLTSVNGRTVIHDGSGNITSHGAKTFTYTAFGKVRTVADSTGSLSFLYDADGDRVRRREAAGDTITLGTLYERKVTAGGATVSATCRIPVGDRIVSQVRFAPNGPGWTTVVSYVHDDALGSTHVVSSSDAVNPITVQASIAYDPWGRARKADNWTQWASTADTAKPGIGFTGHRAELDVGLVDMGGRMYDPTIARFTSPDPLVADPYQGQAYNRYSYVGNRPFRFTDPSGWAGEPTGHGGADFQDSGTSFYTWAIDWANSQASRWNASLINTYYEPDPNPVFAEDFGTMRDEALRWAWSAGPGLVKKWAEAAIEQVEQLIAMAEMIHKDPVGFGLAVGSELWKEFEGNLSTLYHLLPRMKAAYESGDYQQVLDVWLEGAKAAWSIAAIFVGGGAAAAGKVARRLRAGMGIGRKASSGATGGTRATKRVNLPPWKEVKIDMGHIARRHMDGGSEVTGWRGMFPSTMGQAGVEQAVRQAYRFGSTTKVQGTRVRLRGQGGGMMIEMWFDRATATIETAYPVAF